MPTLSSNFLTFLTTALSCLVLSSSVSANSEIQVRSINDQAAILDIQTKLNELGFNAGIADGIWGQRSSNAFNSFIDRYPSFSTTNEMYDPIAQLNAVHRSWFASPFSAESQIVTPRLSLRNRRVFVSDIRAAGMECNACNIVTMILGAGDFDGDGIDELLVGQHVSDNGQPQNIPTPLILLDKIETGNAELLEVAGPVSPIARVHEREAAIADFNGDGVDDFFVASHGYDAQPFPGEQNILVLSTPEGPRDFSRTNIPQIDDMAHGADAGDIDGDGDVDIVVITNDGAARYEPYVLLNDGSANFEKRSLASFLNASNIVRLYSGGERDNQFSSVRLLDLNRDNLPELLLLRSDPSPSRRYTTSHILWNNGHGEFSGNSITNLQTDRWSTATFTNDAEAADLNDDGLIDLILTQSTRPSSRGNWRGQFIQILLQTEAGTFIDDTAARIWPQGYPVPLDQVSFADETELVDLDADGDVDIVTRSLGPATRTKDLSQAIVQIGLNDGTGHFIPLDPRWLSGNRDYRFRGPIPGNFGPNGSVAVISYRVYGIYNNSRDVTWGAEFYLHTMP